MSVKIAGSLCVYARIWCNLTANALRLITTRTVFISDSPEGKARNMW